MPVCAICGVTFKVKRADARSCSARCRKAASRRAEGGQGGDVTDNLIDHASDSCHASMRPQSGQSRMSGESFTFSEDTIAGRRGRVVDRWLECEAMGGWKRVLEIADSTDLARRLAWLSGATITAVSLAPGVLGDIGGTCQRSLRSVVSRSSFGLVLLRVPSVSR